MTDPIAKYDGQVWGGVPSVATEEVEAFLADLATKVTFVVETTVFPGGAGIARSQDTHITGDCDEVYKRHPKIRISLRRALMVLGKRNLQRLRESRVTG